ncbi:calcium-activated chloride channel regulator 4A-like [Ptychodera flava]|uniref:calcium-activated chloride channel regulator 4A-like n=1 Tax=Ptychodera flava TaxID=63121 RepID=UPI00396A5C1E
MVLRGTFSAVTLLSIVLASVSTSYCNRNQVELIDHGYGDVLIAIHESIPEDARIINRLKDIFTGASAHLHTATNHWTYFKDVTILIPKTWSDNLRDRAATYERFDIANVVIDQPNPAYSDNPYTRQTRGCGEPGDFIHFTEKWVTDEMYSLYYWGDPGKVVVHEWAHLRWGVYDEYPIKDNEHFYYDQNGHVQPTRCSTHVTGASHDISDNYRRCNTNPASGVMPGKGCRFFPDLQGNSAAGSYLYGNYLSSVEHFCRGGFVGDPSSRHNRLANNRQNRLCCYKSAWEVMLQHPDFPNDGVPSRERLESTTPNIVVVQEVDLRIVLVLDVSGSMDDNNRLEQMIQASAKYIGYTIPTNTWTGIVEFSEQARTLSDLVKLDSNFKRKNLINVLPDDADGATCIGCGLIEGVKVLEKGENSASGGIIFLITDGEENRDPRIADVIDDLVAKEVIVDTLALSDEADDGLAELSARTGGTAYWYSESPVSTALHDAFTDTILSRTGRTINTPVQLASYKTTINGRATHSSYVYIDSSIGRDTIFFVFWDFDSRTAVEVEVTSPDGTTIDKYSPNYLKNDDTHTIAIEIGGTAQVGFWHYQIHYPRYGSKVVAEVSIESRSASSTVGPIRLWSTLGASVITESPPRIIIYAELSRAYHPVTKANVTALVERPSPHSVVELPLRDNGMGADVTADDGVYSAYFLDFVVAVCQTSCRYGIQIVANDELGSAVIIGAANSPAMPTDLSVLPEIDEPSSTGDFSRVSSGGSFQVDNSVVIPPAGTDLFKPARIADLTASGSSYEERTITLQWTAVGDNLDQGTAAYYDARYSTSHEGVLDNFDNATKITEDDVITGDLSSPLPSSSLETVVVRMPTRGTGTTYFFAVRAVDAAGNEGDISNVAQSTIVPLPYTGLAGWEIFLICLGVLAAITVICIISWLVLRRVKPEWFAKKKVTPTDEETPKKSTKATKKGKVPKKVVTPTK